MFQIIKANRKLLIMLIGCILLICFAMLFFTACDNNNLNNNDDDNNTNKTIVHQRIDIEVINPLTGDKIWQNEEISRFYDELPQNDFEVRLRISGYDDYLENEDFNNNDWKSHMALYISTGGSEYTRVSDWENDWPTEIGNYKVKLQFNNDYSYDPKYYTSYFEFSLKIE